MQSTYFDSGAATAAFMPEDFLQNHLYNQQQQPQQQLASIEHQNILDIGQDMQGMQEIEYLQGMNYSPTFDHSNRMIKMNRFISPEQMKVAVGQEEIAAAQETTIQKDLIESQQQQQPTCSTSTAASAAAAMTAAAPSQIQLQSLFQQVSRMFAAAAAAATAATTTTKPPSTESQQKNSTMTTNEAIIETKLEEEREGPCSGGAGYGYSYETRESLNNNSNSNNEKTFSVGMEIEGEQIQQQQQSQANNSEEEEEQQQQKNKNEQENTFAMLPPLSSLTTLLSQNTAQFYEPAAATATTAATGTTLETGIASKPQNEADYFKHWAKQFELLENFMKAGGVAAAMASASATTTTTASSASSTATLGNPSGDNHSAAVTGQQLQSSSTSQHKTRSSQLFQSPSSISSATTITKSTPVRCFSRCSAANSLTSSIESKPVNKNQANSSSGNGNEMKQNLNTLFELVERRSQIQQQSIQTPGTAFVPRVIQTSFTTTASQSSKLPHHHMLPSAAAFAEKLRGNLFTDSSSLIEFIAYLSKQSSQSLAQAASGSGLQAGQKSLRGLLSTLDPHTITLQALLAHHHNGLLEMTDLLRIQDEKRLDRQFKIERYKNKRRNWIRTVSYDCRKRVADSRLRIKGRFISKKDSEILKSNEALGLPTTSLTNKQSSSAEGFDGELIEVKSYSQKKKQQQQQQKPQKKKGEKQLSRSQKMLTENVMESVKKRISKKQSLFVLIRNDVSAATVAQSRTSISALAESSHEEEEGEDEVVELLKEEVEEEEEN